MGLTSSLSVERIKMIWQLAKEPDIIHDRGLGSRELGWVAKRFGQFHMNSRKRTLYLRCNSRELIEQVYKLAQPRH